MFGGGGRAYGLILRKKPSSVPLTRKSIFGESSSDEEEEGRQTVNKTIKKEAEKNRQMRQTQIEIDKVLEEDPTAYEYDEVYDEMAEKKAASVAASTAVADRKPKYISNLLKFAETRKKEQERRVERQVQKEREEEGSEFADKDAFVTSAYRKRMQELAEDEERQRKLDELESDVTKQADLSKFYRNLLDKNVSTGGAYNSEDPTKIVEKNNRARETLPSGVDDGSKKAKSSNKTKHSEHDEKKQEMHNDRQRSRETDDRREGPREKLSGKSDCYREKDDRQRKDSPERYTKRQKKEQEHRRPTKSEKPESDDEQPRTSGSDREQRGSMIRDQEQDNSERDVDGQKGTEMDTDGSHEEKMDNEKQCEGKTDGRMNENKREDKVAGKKRKEESGERGVSKFAKHTTKEAVLSARERYLARKNARVVIQHVSDEDD